jgi:hypothetical protein
MFLLAAMRAHCFIKLLRRRSLRLNMEHVKNCIDEAIVFGARLIRSRTKAQIDRHLHFPSDEDSCDENADVSAADAHGLNTSFSIHTQRGAANMLGLWAPGTDKSSAAECMETLRQKRTRTKKTISVFDEYTKMLACRDTSVGCICAVEYSQCLWIGYKAFRAALGQRVGTYASVLRHIDSVIASHALGIDEVTLMKWQDILEKKNAESIMWETEWL